MHFQDHKFGPGSESEFPPCSSIITGGNCVLHQMMRYYHAILTNAFPLCSSGPKIDRHLNWVIKLCLYRPRPHADYFC